MILTFLSNYFFKKSCKCHSYLEINPKFDPLYGEFAKKIYWFSSPFVQSLLINDRQPSFFYFFFYSFLT